jgi:two-component system cell cycle response regulator
MIDWMKMIEFSLLPVLGVALSTSMHFYGVRKKRGYKTVAIGSGFLVIGFLVEILQWLNVSFLKTSLSTLHHIGQILQFTGWYITIIGLVQLYRLIPRRARMALFAGSILWIAVGAFPFWIAGLFAGALYITISFFIERWMGHSSLLIVWLLRSLGVSGIGLAAMELKMGQQITRISEWLHVLGILVTACLVLLIIISRVSYILDRSYRSSITDALTGLYNRKYFYTLIQKYIEKAVEISIIFVDLDNFKRLNDSQGHDAGDDALRVIASILKEESEGRGIAGRYGGEEMVMVITQEKFDMETLGERIRIRIEKESPVTASIGFATWARGIAVKEFVDRADRAMYFSKTNGKNRVTGFQN